MKTNVQKKEIITELSNKTGYSVSFAKKIINDLISSLTFIICEGKLYLKNFGVFEIIKKKQRLGRNPKTKQEFIIKQRNIIKFKPSKKLFIELNDI